MGEREAKGGGWGELTFIVTGGKKNQEGFKKTSKKKKKTASVGRMVPQG